VREQRPFSFTGWKVGWPSGPAALVQAAQAAHHFLPFAGATPPQLAMADALRDYGGGYLSARHLVERCGMVAIAPSPLSAAAPDEGRRLVRFAFCKQLQTLRLAVERLAPLAA
jgi:N-succinyldiaminopimelate aminotransferase